MNISFKRNYFLIYGPILHITEQYNLSIGCVVEWSKFKHGGSIHTFIILSKGEFVSRSYVMHYVNFGKKKKSQRDTDDSFKAIFLSPTRNRTCFLSMYLCFSNQNINCRVWFLNVLFCTIYKYNVLLKVFLFHDAQYKKTTNTFWNNNDIILLTHFTAALAQSIRPFASHSENWVFQSQPQRT